MESPITSANRSELMKKLKLPARPSAAVEILRNHLRQIWSPIDWENVSLETETFDILDIVMNVTFYTANAMARELGVSVMTITRAVHRGLISPARATSGTMLFTPEQLETLRLHLSK